MTLLLCINVIPDVINLKCGKGVWFRVAVTFLYWCMGPCIRRCITLEMETAKLAKRVRDLEALAVTQA